VVEEAATPFDRRRHGMIIGMGAAGLVVESAEAVRERGLNPICEVLSTATANSAFHGTRLDVDHIGQVMEKLVARAESSSGMPRHSIAGQMVFVSHETYTPARGGSASAEIYALRKVFERAADRIVIANTKGFTGHPMAAGIEDVVAVKALETGCIPPVANFKEVDPELGALHLSKGGAYPIEFALRLGAGFGSQISMTLLRRVPTVDGTRRNASQLGYAYRIADRNAWTTWLSRVSGLASADLEVVNRTLRVRDEGPRAQAEVARELRHTAEQPPIEEVQVAPAAAEVKSAAPASVPVMAHSPVAEINTVKEQVFALVAAKTGYPVDMLDPDLDLEADLGVDTVKQAEVFASIRETYGIQRDDKIKLRDYPTLGHVIRFVEERRPDIAAASIQAPVADAAIPPPNESGTDAADPVRERILDLMVEKTGYPKDMLDLDLDLEADLGVDTVKQAELFAAVREVYNIARDENRKLRDFPTIAHVIRFVYDKRPELKAAARPAAPRIETVPAAAAVLSDKVPVDEMTEKVLAIVTEKTGYPKEMLDLDLDLEADLGIDTVKQAEMFASVRAAFNIPRDTTLKLREFPTLAHVVRFARERSAAATHTAEVVIAESASAAAVPAVGIEEAKTMPRRIPMPVLRPPLQACKKTAVSLHAGSRVVIMPDCGGVAETLTAKLLTLGVEVLRLERTVDADALSLDLKEWAASGPVTGIYWLPALDAEGDLDGMDVEAWRNGLRVRVKLLYSAMRVLYDQVASPGTFLVAATRLDGQHGYSDSGAVAAPMGGAVTGFTKTYKRERPEAIVKAIDFDAAETPATITARLIDETLADPGAVEIGYKDDLRWTVGLNEEATSNGQPGVTLSRDSVFVITGAAGSIVSAITADLAAASGGMFYLLDLVPEPDSEDDDLKRFTADKDGLKRDLFARIQARGERATPALVEKELAALERKCAALNAIEAARAAGGTAEYFSVDLTNAEAVAKIIGHVRNRSGRIDVLLHGAGIEKSHLLPDKEPREFDAVFDVKADGWFHVMHAINSMPVAATVAFSSIAARFGNAGQADYSAANDLLCKIASSFAATRRSTRAIAIDWTAWADIGMASRGSIPKMMELAGIETLPLRAAVPVVRRELSCGAARGEIVIARSLGALLNEWDISGGLDAASASERVATPGPMSGTIARWGIHEGLVIQTTLDPAVQAFLHDHRIEGTPVLPGVMAMEAFAEAAVALVPGWQIDAIEDVDFSAPFKYYRDEPRALTIEVVIQPRRDELVARCRILGHRNLAGQPNSQVTEHFTGRVLLTQSPRVAAIAGVPGPPRGSGVEAADIYAIYFHGPAYQVIERAWLDGNRIIGKMKPRLPENHHPAELAALVAPRLVELCFQTAGIWEIAVNDRLGLPLHMDRLRLYRAANQPDGTLFAIVTPDANDGTFDAEVVDSNGNLHLRVSGYRTIPLPDRIDAARLKALHAVLA
jgi:NAD(P)-dependent dehydrogenase (short-subunit alcohol dehydrogenase family)/acyl carrier protein